MQEREKERTSLLLQTRDPIRDNFPAPGSPVEPGTVTS